MNYAWRSLPFFIQMTTMNARKRDKRCSVCMNTQRLSKSPANANHLLGLAAVRCSCDQEPVNAQVCCKLRVRNRLASKICMHSVQRHLVER